jgi:heme oxygenase
MRVGRLRERLRAATSASHERLHRHPGLAAAASGAIDLSGYRALLMRLYGFHRPVDAGMGAHTWLTDETPRSRLLESDLQALGVTRDQQDVLPRCATLPLLTDDAQALGALYVVEGSALGGAAIARAVAPVLAPLEGDGCRFFSNDSGKRRGWPQLLVRLESLSGESQEQATIDAAVATFLAFEAWMKDWGPKTDARPLCV